MAKKMSKKIEKKIEKWHRGNELQKINEAISLAWASARANRKTVISKKQAK